MRSAAADRVAALARRLAEVIDLPTAEQLARVVSEAGDSEAVVRAERGNASVGLILAELGNPDDRDDLDRVYLEAEAIATDVAARLDLPPADELAVDGLA